MTVTENMLPKRIQMQSAARATFVFPSVYIYMLMSAIVRSRLIDAPEKIRKIRIAKSWRRLVIGEILKKLLYRS